MSTLRVDTITNAAGSAGPTFSGNSIITGSLQVNGTLLDSGGQDILANLGNADRLENGSTQIILSANDLSPDSNNTRDLGKSGTRFRNGYFGSQVYAGFPVDERRDVRGTASIGGSSNQKIYDETPPAGTYLVSSSLQFRGSSPNGDPDQCIVRLVVNGSEVCRSSIMDQDSGQLSHESYGQFAALFYVNGSQNAYVDIWTTDPGDPGGGDVNYQCNVFKIG